MLCLHLMQPTNRFSPLDVALKKVLLWRSILRLDLLHVIQLLKSTFEFEDDQIYSNSLERWSSIFFTTFYKGCHQLSESFIFWAHVTSLTYSANVQSTNAPHTWIDIAYTHHKKLLADSPQGLNLSRRVAGFVTSLYEIFKEQFFTYLEINPLVVTDSAIFVLDLAAKVMTNTLSFLYFLPNLSLLSLFRPWQNSWASIFSFTTHS